MLRSVLQARYDDLQGLSNCQKCRFCFGVLMFLFIFLTAFVFEMSKVLYENVKRNATFLKQRGEEGRFVFQLSTMYGCL